jgi:hypothetical protein
MTDQNNFLASDEIHVRYQYCQYNNNNDNNEQKDKQENNEQESNKQEKKVFPFYSYNPEPKEHTKISSTKWSPINWDFCSLNLPRELDPNSNEISEEKTKKRKEKEMEEKNRNDVWEDLFGNMYYDDESHGPDFPVIGHNKKNNTITMKVDHETATKLREKTDQKIEVLFKPEISELPYQNLESKDNQDTKPQKRIFKIDFATGRIKM